MEIQELEQYWNNKHPKNPVVYTGRALPVKSPEGITLIERVKIDVRTMLTPECCLLQSIVAQNNLKQSTLDKTMEEIQKYVVRTLKYIGDDISQGTVEYWQFPYETIQYGNGDCEDGALLIAALATNSGIPAFRVRVVAGMVQPSPTAPEGGHGYVSYLREHDNQWVCIDWCYLEDSQVPMPNKPVIKDNPAYKDMWFSFNHQYSWSNTTLEFQSF